MPRSACSLWHGVNLNYKKHFDASQRSVKIKIQVNFYFNTCSWNVSGEMQKGLNKQLSGNLETSTSEVHY